MSLFGSTSNLPKDAYKLNIAANHTGFLGFERPPPTPSESLSNLVHIIMWGYGASAQAIPEDVVPPAATSFDMAFLSRYPFLYLLTHPSFIATLVILALLVFLVHQSQQAVGVPVELKKMRRDMSVVQEDMSDTRQSLQETVEAIDALRTRYESFTVEAVRRLSGQDAEEEEVVGEKEE